MKIKGKILINIALIMFVLYTITDRFIFVLPNIVAIPILILGIIMMFAGWYMDKAKK